MKNQKKIERENRREERKRAVRYSIYSMNLAVSQFFRKKVFRLSDDRKPKSMSVAKWKEKGFITFMLSFAILNFLIFWVYVNFNSILMAFQTYDAAGNIQYGFQNFAQIFQDFAAGVEHLEESLVNTMIFFAVNLFCIFPVSIFISFMLYNKIWGYKIYRVVYFLPSIISPIVLTVVFKTFIHSETGPLLPFLEWIGFKNVQGLNLLGDSRYALKTIVGYCIWTGFATNIVLFNGAMSRIPEEIVESARIDGLGIIGELFYITLPMIWPTISTLLVFACVGIFSSSGPIMLFTNGDYGTYTLSFLIFAKVFYSGEVWFPYTSALGLIFTLIGVPLVILIRWALSKIGQDIEY